MASGALIERIGYPLTISICCGIGLLFTLLIGMKWRASMWQTSVAARATSVPQRV
jgi:xanthine/uracil/vitamin C permease (AzgA family)